RRRSPAVVTLAAFILIAACNAPGASPSPSSAASGADSFGPRPSSPATISIVEPQDGATISGTTVHVKIDLEKATITSSTTTSAASTLVISGGASPAIVVATTENPPQAQLIASPGTFAIPTGTTSLIATITPVRPSADQARTPITGNVYRFSVVGDAGSPISL